MPRKVRAAVAFAPNQPLELRELDLADPGPGDVLVRFLASGLCHSDLHALDGTIDERFPLVAESGIRTRADVRRMHAAGLGGILAVGRPNQPLLGIPVAAGYSGMIVVGGLNPIAAIHEAGLPVTIRSLAGLEDYTALKPIEDWESTLSQSVGL